MYAFQHAQRGLFQESAPESRPEPVQRSAVLNPKRKDNRIDKKSETLTLRAIRGRRLSRIRLCEKEEERSVRHSGFGNTDEEKLQNE